MTEQPWSEYEIRYLYEHYPSKRAVDVAAALNRTKGSIHHKASKLGIHKDDGFFPVKSAAIKASHKHMDKRITSKGYVIVYAPDHPFASKTGHVMEHRLVVEKHIGHYLDKDMDVHHINGIKTDNRLENLLVMTHAEHTTFHNLEGKHE